MLQYLIRVRDHNNTDFLREYGYIQHVAKLSGLVVLEGEAGLEHRLGNHSEILSIRLSDKFSTAKV